MPGLTKAAIARAARAGGGSTSGYGYFYFRSTKNAQEFATWLRGAGYEVIRTKTTVYNAQRATSPRSRG